MHRILQPAILSFGPPVVGPSVHPSRLAELPESLHRPAAASPSAEGNA